MDYEIKVTISSDDDNRTAIRLLNAEEAYRSLKSIHSQLIDALRYIDTWVDEEGCEPDIEEVRGWIEDALIYTQIDGMF